MSLRKFVGIIHPRIAVVAHDLAMAALRGGSPSYCATPSSRMRSSPIQLLRISDRAAGARADLPLDRAVQKRLALRQLAGSVEHLRAVVVGAVAIGVSLFLYDRLDGVPRSVLLLYPILLAVLAWRSTAGLSLLERQPSATCCMNKTAKRVMIVGADRAGEVLVARSSPSTVATSWSGLSMTRQAAWRQHQWSSRAWAFRQLVRVAREAAVEMLLIALPGASTTEMRRWWRYAMHRPAISHGAAARGRGCRARAVQSDQGSGDRGSARSRFGGAGLDRDPRDPDRAPRAGDRRWWFDRFGIVPTDRPARACSRSRSSSRANTTSIASPRNCARIFPN
jgi:hypothetical protein